MIKRRNMLMQVLLFIITIGIYGVYWFYFTSSEMVDHKRMTGNPVVWAILFVFPITDFYAMWQHSKAVQTVTDGKYSNILIFILWILFSPAMWAITQSELNRLADKQLAEQVAVETSKS